MKWNNRALRNGVLVVLVLIVGRMLLVGAFGDGSGLFSKPRIASFLLKAETGKEPVTQPAQTPDSQEQTEPTQTPTEPAQQGGSATVTDPQTPTFPLELPKSSYLFAEGDEALTTINYMANKEVDIAAALKEKLEWDLTSEEPAVLIVHTHGTEAFTQVEGSTYAEEGGAFRTTNSDYNVISVGTELARLLEEAGIHVIHDLSYYDYPDYDSAYDNCRVGIQEHLKKHPSIRLVIDLHRDSSENEDGSQWISDVTVNGEKSAQVMMVLGTDTYYTHPDWEKNLSVALQLNTVMEKNHPGVTRPLSLRRQRFNQDLFPASFLVEIGSAGNTHAEAMNAVSVLAEAIILMAKGAN